MMEKRYSSTLSSTSALDGVGCESHAPAALPPGKRPATLWTGDWGGSEGKSRRMRKTSPSPGVFVLHSLVLCTSSVLVSVSSLSCIFPRVFTCNAQTQTSMSPAGFKPATPASHRPQTLALDRSATGIGRDSIAGPSSPQPVAIPTDLSRPVYLYRKIFKITTSINCSNNPLLSDFSLRRFGGERKRDKERI